MFECFNIYKPIILIPNILDDEDKNLVIDEVINNKDFEKSYTELETDDSVEELKYPQKYNFNQSIVNILDDLNQRKINDPRVQAMFKRSRHNCFFFLYNKSRLLRIR